MPKFKIGDKVYIKPDLITGQRYGDSIFFSEMKNLKGRILTVREVRNEKGKTYYRFPESSYYYIENMLEPVKSYEGNYMTMPKLETGMFIITKYDDIGVVVNDNILYYHGGFINKSSLLNYIRQDSGKDYIRYILKNECGFEHIRAFLEEIKSQKTILGIQVLWKYEESIPEVTLDEVYQKFGHKVKIIDQQ